MWHYFRLLVIGCFALPFYEAFLLHAPAHRGLAKPNLGPRVFLMSSASGPTYENVGLQRQDPTGSTLGLTENKALTYHATVDLFFDVNPGTPKSLLYKLLERGWNDDALLTLKIIFQLGDPRGGKCDRENFYRCLLWLYVHHHQTLLINLHHLREFACYKAMLDLLVLVARGPDALDDKRAGYGNSERRVPVNWSLRKLNRKNTREVNIDTFFASLPQDVASEFNPQNVLDEGGRWKNNELKEKFVAFMNAQDQEKSRLAASLRKRKREMLLNHARELHSADSKFQLLYDKVADIFAEDLIKERKQYDEGKNISGLVAKWAPTPNLSHDKQTNICEGIITRLYGDDPSCKPQDHIDDQEGYLFSLRRFVEGIWEGIRKSTTEADHGGRDCDLRDLYRKEYLSSLRRAAEVPESFTGSGDWNLVNYKRMASRCRLQHGEMYRRHDQERYDEYLEATKRQVEQGGRITMIAAGTLLPHDLCKRALSDSRKGNDELGLQWIRIVQDVKDSGKLSNALAICDVSGSMAGKPMDVAVALSLLVADASEGHWSGKAITFSQSPELVSVPKATTDNLACRVTFLRGIKWGYNTDFQKVFDLLLEDAKERLLPPDAMPSILFCFSDMEFDQAHEGNWKTDLELIRGKYEKSNYKVPEIVFWNLRPSRSKPASKYEPGVVMLSGFSAGLMKSFLELRLDEFNPLTQLEAMLQKYDCLTLADEDL
jgi:Domain of unknown function (DUF2828)